MHPLLSLNAARCPGLTVPFTGDFKAGNAYVIVTTKEEESMALARLFVGIAGCVEGSFMVEGKDISSFSPSELNIYRRRIGVVPTRGGLISNLKLWENITLPLLFHDGAVSLDAERRGQELLKYFNYTGRLMTLPSLLSPDERRIAVWVRMLLTEPELVVYANSFDEMPAASLSLFLKTAADFHEASAQRTSLYITSNPELTARFTIDGTFVTMTPHTTISRAQ